MAFLAAPLRGEITMNSNFDPQVVAVGEYTRLNIVISGSATSSMQATLPVVDGLVILDTPSTSSKVNIVNGTVTSFVQYSYPVRSTKDGTFTVPQFAVIVDGRQYLVPSASFTATKSGMVDNDAMLIQVDAPMRMYVGQSAEADLNLLIRSDLRLGGGVNPRKSSGDEIIQQPFDPKLARDGRTTRGTISYSVINVPMLITATKAGSQTLEYDCDAQIITPRRSSSAIGGRGDPLQEMMRNMQSMSFDDMSTRVVSAHGGTHIEVRPLPPNAPASFDGAVGILSASRSLGSKTSKVGEPIELTLSISGQGDLKQIFAPRLGDDDDWRAYPPTDQTTQEDTFGLKGTKTFKYLLTPLRPGTLSVPPLTFSYLNTDSGEYVETVLSGETVEVANAPGAIAPPPASKANKSDQAALPKDGLHAISLLYTSPPAGALLPPQRNKIFLLAQVVPALLLAWGIIVPMRRRLRERDPLARLRNIYTKAAASALTKATRAAKAKDGSAFFDQARNGLRNALAAADPNRQPDTISAADLIRHLGTEDTDDRRKINLLFNGNEALRHGTMNMTLEELRVTLSNIVERLKVK